jgi:AraC-like DNA-binding protein
MSFKNKNSNFPVFRLYGISYTKLSDWSRAVPVRPHWRVWWNLRDGASVFFKGAEHLINRRSIVVVPPGTSILHKLKNPVESLAVHFAAGIPYDFAKGFVVSLVPAEWMSGILENITSVGFSGYDTASRPSPLTDDLKLAHLLCGILAELPTGLWPETVIDKRMGKIIDQIENNLQSPLSNSELSKFAGLSRNAFIRSFKQATGLPPAAFQISRRLEKASAELRSSTLSVDEISEKYAFCDRHYFSRMFIKKFGVGPSTYRKSSE